MQSKRRVVIIDDEPAFAELLTKMVTTVGHDVVVKADSSASHTYELRDSDVVFIEVMMPKVNGFEILEQLARQNVKCEIVIMSEDGKHLNEAEKLLKKLDLNFLGVLEKPFRLADVQDILE